jgi:hypothetical protein
LLKDRALGNDTRNAQSMLAVKTFFAPPLNWPNCSQFLRFVGRDRQIPMAIRHVRSLHEQRRRERQC